MIRTYSELITIKDYKERFRYLVLKASVGEQTFGSRRYLNQILYSTPDWKRIRRDVIIRDNGCDLAHPDYEITYEPIYVHHLNPISIDDILNHDPKVFDMNNLISTVFSTHQAIHYGDESMLMQVYTERRPNDTCPWKA